MARSKDDTVPIDIESLTWLITLAEFYLEDLDSGIKDGTYENSKENKHVLTHGYYSVEKAHKALT